MAQEIEYYRGYRLEVRTFGPGWIVFIYPPGDMFALKQTPSTRDKDERGDIVIEAKAVIDSILTVSS